MHCALIVIKPCTKHALYALIVVKLSSAKINSKVGSVVLEYGNVLI